MISRLPQTAEKKQTASLPIIYLRPGALYVTSRPVIVKTILGSCVSVTLFNRKHRVGGICHALLPECKKTANCPKQCDEPFKYLNCALRELFGQFSKLAPGYPSRDLEIKLFGGAVVLDRAQGGPPALTVGDLNIQAAKDILKLNNLPLKVAEVGGLSGCKILFNTHTGKVWLKRIKRIGDSIGSLQE